MQELIALNERTRFFLSIASLDEFVGLSELEITQIEQTERVPSSKSSWKPFLFFQRYEVVSFGLKNQIVIPFFKLTL